MSFTYNLNIPAANNNPSADQPNMKTNTNSIDSIINVDHFKFSAGNAGRHKQVTLTNQAAPGFTGGNGVLFASLATGNSWPFWQNAAGTFNLLGPLVASANGYTSAGGLLIQWGFVSGGHGGGVFNGGDNAVQAFNIPFPTNVFVVWTQPSYKNPAPSGEATVALRTSQILTTGFEWTFVTSSGQYNQFYWIALGN